MRVSSGTGRVAAYASVVDNVTNDPLLVRAVRLGTPVATRYVFPGAANLPGSGANWRTDLRLFNGSSVPQNATLTFHSFGGVPIDTVATIQPGQVLGFDDVLGDLFHLTGGGTVHVTTDNASNLLLTGRTYAQLAQGTYGQFIEAALPSDAATRENMRVLQLIHVEDSPRYRTNLGVAEIAGSTARVEITVRDSEGRALATYQRTLTPFELLQFRAIHDLDLGDVYNGRITVRVIEGDGSVVGYVSVVDNHTQDPTFVSAQ